MTGLQVSRTLDQYCPRCGGALEHDAVDIGVGTMYGPTFCID